MRTLPHGPGAPLTPDYEAGPTGGTRSSCPTRPRAAARRLSTWRGGRGVHGAWRRPWRSRRGGRHVVVLDSDDIGAGASSRNGGMAHPGGKHDVSEFLEPSPRGAGSGTRPWPPSRAWVRSSAELGVDCDWHRCGHLELAHHPRVAAHQRAVADAYASIGEEARFLGAARAGAEIGSRPVLRRPAWSSAARACTRPSWRPAWRGPPPRPGRGCTGRPPCSALERRGAGLRARDVPGCAAVRARSWWRPTARPIGDSCRGSGGASSASAAT